MNVDVGEVKEAKDAQENGQAPSAGGEKKKRNTVLQQRKCKCRPTRRMLQVASAISMDGAGAYKMAKTVLCAK